jgi:hypothetical protein
MGLRGLGVGEECGVDGGVSCGVGFGLVRLGWAGMDMIWDGNYGFGE